MTFLKTAFGCAEEGGFDLVCFSWEGLRPRGAFVLGRFSPTTDEEVVSDLGGF